MIDKSLWVARPKTVCAIADIKGVYRDVYIRRVSKRNNTADVCELVDIDYPAKYFTVPLDACIPPLVPDINTRYAYMDQLIELAIEGGIKALFITGDGGIGKSYTVENALERMELEYGTDYALIKGHSTPRATYNLLKEYHDRVVIFDDCDSVFAVESTVNILKAVLDAWAKRRTVSWLTTRKGGDEVVRQFEFTGTVIFVSNKSRTKLDKALLTRCVVVDMDMTVEDKITRLEHLLTTVDSPLRMTDRRKVFAVIRQFRYNITELNIRTLLKALDIYNKTKGNIELVRYQILQ